MKPKTNILQKKSKVWPVGEYTRKFLELSAENS